MQNQNTGTMGHCTGLVTLTMVQTKIKQSE